MPTPSIYVSSGKAQLVTPHFLYKFLLVWARFGATNLSILSGPWLLDFCALTIGIKKFDV